MRSDPGFVVSHQHRLEGSLGSWWTASPIQLTDRTSCRKTELAAAWNLPQGHYIIRAFKSRLWPAVHTNSNICMTTCKTIGMIYSSSGLIYASLMVPWKAQNLIHGIKGCLGIIALGIIAWKMLSGLNTALWCDTCNTNQKSTCGALSTFQHIQFCKLAQLKPLGLARHCFASWLAQWWSLIYCVQIGLTSLARGALLGATSLEHIPIN